MKTIQKITKTTLFIFLTTVLIVGCGKDDDNPKPTQPPTSDNELITTVKLTFVDTNGIEPTVIVRFRDPDGDGGNPPVQFDTIKLKANTVYNATLELFNESTSPVTNVSGEVFAEADEHLFCYTPAGVNLTIIRTDSDGVFELGLKTLWTTGNTSVGTTKVVLKHQPGVKDGTCSPGDTDVELDFVTVLQ